MQMTVHDLSQQLLERLANSVYDRDPTNPNPFFFNISELRIVEEWLDELLYKKAPME